MATELHQERLDCVLRHLLDSAARSVVDLGCGTGELLCLLAGQAQFQRILGIDIDREALAEARLLLGLELAATGGRIDIQQASFEQFDRALMGFDAAVLLETIEHIEPGRLARVEQAVFGQMRPTLVLVTTPNQEYNLVYGMAPGQMRHPGHRFEWSRPRFQQWAQGVADRQRYRVRFIDIGPPHPLHGSSTQMARFEPSDD